MMQANIQQQANLQAQMNNVLQNSGNNQQPTTTQNPTATSSMPQPSGPGICVIFRASGATGQAGAPIMVQCMNEDKVSSVIEKYRSKASDNDTTKKFIFNAKNLNPSLTVAEAGLTNNANIFVVATKGIKGAF